MSYRRSSLPRLAWISTFVIASALAGVAIHRAVAATAPAPAPGAPASAPAAPSANVPAADSAAIKKLVEQKFPGATVGGITRAPFPGLYEVQFDDQIVYTDAKV